MIAQTFGGHQTLLGGLASVNTPFGGVFKLIIYLSFRSQDLSGITVAVPNKRTLTVKRPNGGTGS